MFGGGRRGVRGAAAGRTDRAARDGRARCARSPTMRSAARRSIASTACSRTIRARSSMRPARSSTQHGCAQRRRDRQLERDRSRQGGLGRPRRRARAGRRRALGGAEMSRGYGVARRRPEGRRAARARPRRSSCTTPTLLATLPRARARLDRDQRLGAHDRSRLRAHAARARRRGGDLRRPPVAGAAAAGRDRSAIERCTARSSKRRTWPASRSTRARWACTTPSATSSAA